MHKKIHSSVRHQATKKPDDKQNRKELDESNEKQQNDNTFTKHTIGMTEKTTPSSIQKTQNYKQIRRIEKKKKRKTEINEKDSPKSEKTKGNKETNLVTHQKS